MNHDRRLHLIEVGPRVCAHTNDQLAGDLRYTVSDRDIRRQLSLVDDDLVERRLLVAGQQLGEDIERVLVLVELLDRGEAGDNIGALLRGIDREGVERGQVLCKPGSVKPHTKFTAEAYILTKEEGGRHTPFFANYRPQFYFRTTDVTGEVILPEGTEMVMPGDNVTISVKLIAPIAMDEGLRFAIREGGRTVGSGVVANITK